MSASEVKARYYTLAAISTMLAWGLEYYDIILYSTLASILEAVFKLSLLEVWFAFALSYIVRPLGAFIFGHLGDRYGRRTITAIDAAMMGLASLAIGLLPGYSQVGILAPLSLYIIRVIQGIGLGGEAGGGATWALEQVNPRWKPILNGVMYSGLSWAVFLTGALSIALQGITGRAFSTWGWRILFFIGAVLALIALVIRLVGLESPEWERARERGTIRRVPIASRDVWNINMLILMLINLGLTIYYYGGLGYWGYIIPRLIAPHTPYTSAQAQEFVYTLITYGGLGAVIGELLSGPLIYSVGIRRSFIYASIPLALLSIPNVYLAFTFSRYAAYITFISGILFGLAAAPQTIYFTSLFPTESRWSAVSVGWNINSVIGAFGSLASTEIILWTMSMFGTFTFYIAGSLIMVIGSLLVVAGSLIKPKSIYARPGEEYLRR